MSLAPDSWKCTAQGFARVYFALVEFALVTAITLTCYVMIVKHEFRIQEARFCITRMYFVLYSFVVFVVLTIVCFCCSRAYQKVWHNIVSARGPMF